MSPLGWHLKRRGFRVLNFGYPSRHESIGAHAERLLRFARERTGDGPLNFVTHSLGGIVVRTFALRYHAEFSLHRAVLLGPPNRGAALARTLHHHLPVIERIMGPSYREIGELDLAPATDLLQIGIVAGSLGERRSWLPFVSPPNDGIVSVHETTLPGAADAIVVAGLHSTLMFQPTVVRATVAFLETGRFLNR